MERARSTPQERWAPNTPQRRLVEHIFSASPWANDYLASDKILDTGELEELDDLLKAVTGFYHMVQVHSRYSEEYIQQIDRLLMALSDPVPMGRGGMVGNLVLRKASGMSVTEISDVFQEMSQLVRVNCVSAVDAADTTPLVAVTEALRHEIIEMSEVTTYPPGDRLHAVAGQIAALYGNGNGDGALRVRLLQQHLSLDARAPLHVVDSPTLRATLRGFASHHDIWAAQQEDGLQQPEAVLVAALTGTISGREPESMREALACMTSDETDEIRATITVYLQRFVSEYGGGVDLHDEETDEDLDWPLAPQFMRRLLAGSDHLGEWVRNAAGSERATRNVLQELRAAHATAPAPYRTPEGDEFLGLVLSGAAVDEAEYAEVIDRLVDLFTTPIEQVNAAGRAVVAGSARTVAVEGFLSRLEDVTNGVASGENTDDGDDDEVIEDQAVFLDDSVQIDGDDDEDELGEEVVDEVVLAREREAAALAASDVADEGEPVDDALEPDAADLDDLDDEVGDGVIPSRTRRTAMTPWSTGGPSTWRPGATVTVQQRTVAARPAAYTKAGVPAVERSTVVVSDFDERRAAQLADRALPEPHVAETGGRQPHDWETLPDDIAGMAVAAVFEALMDSGGLQHEGARRAALAYINNVKLPDDLIARDDIRRGFEAVRRQFDAFARTLPANDRSTVVHTAGSTSLKYLLNGQFSAAAGRISSELDQLSRHVLAYSRAKSA